MADFEFLIQLLIFFRIGVWHKKVSGDSSWHNIQIFSIADLSRKKTIGWSSLDPHTAQENS